MRGSMAGCAVGIVWVITAVVCQAELKIGEWSHRARIETTAPVGKGLVEVALSPEVSDLTRPNRSDLRALDESGKEIPYVLRMDTGKIESRALPVTLLNRTHIPGQQSSVTADFGGKVLKNRIRIVTPGTNFRRRVMVQGADDGVSWEVVRDGSLIFRIADETGKGAAYERDSIKLPDNDWRYLRITVQNGPDDPEVVEIGNVTATSVLRTPPDTTAVPIVSSKLEEKSRGTEIVLDLGFRNLPLYGLDLNFSDANFARGMEILGRNETEITLRTPVEDSPAHTRKVAAPWTPVCRGTIYRYSSGAGDEESLSFDIQPARYRYLLIRIQNRDDQPLTFTGVQVTRLAEYVEFQPKGSGNLFLYFGNLQAQAPEYDLGKYIGKLRAEGITRAGLGNPEPNPVGPTKKDLPWSERYRFIMWIALVAAMAVLGWMVLSLVRRAPKAG